jgi:Ca-activated chloride channel family protein
VIKHNKIYGAIIMIKSSTLISILILFLMPPIVFLGCSGVVSSSSSGSNPTTSTSPSIQVLPSVYDFGSVTPGNSPAPLEVEIINNGSAELIVSDIALSDLLHFDLDLSGGSDPCDTATLTIAEEESCTLEVAFRPQSSDSFSTTLNISSNDPNTSVLSVPISGSQEEVLELNVKINQVETDELCPTATVTAYVSVTDQGGYPVIGLSAIDFKVTEDTTDMGNPGDVSFVEEVTSPISVALVMDYSASITDIEDAVDDMEESTASFISQLGANDEAEIVKFDSEFEVVQDWTSDKDLLTAAIYAPWNRGGLTVLFDAVWKAVDDTASRQKDRKAVIVITDATYDVSEKSLGNVIHHANDNNVPIFTVGLGDADISILQRMADDTGGQFYEATTSDNLRTTYNQVAEVLLKDQYILTYISGLGIGATGDLKIKATSGAIEREDTKEITPCPSP